LEVRAVRVAAEVVAERVVAAEIVVVKGWRAARKADAVAVDEAVKVVVYTLVQRRDTIQGS
jgi:hypothetical protein